jgi:hypothetical protein
MPLATQLVCPTSSISQPISFRKATEVPQQSKPYPSTTHFVDPYEAAQMFSDSEEASFRSSNQRENKLRCIHKSIFDIYFIYPHAWCHYHLHPPPP